MQKIFVSVTALCVVMFAGCTNQKSDTSIQAPVIPVQHSSVSSAQVFDKSQWKTFQNKKYGYGFRYPSEIFEPLSNCGGALQNYVEPVQTCSSMHLFFNPKRTTPVQFDVYDNKENVNPVDYAKALLRNATVYRTIASVAYGKRDAAKAMFAGPLKASTNPKDQGGSMYDQNSTIILISLRNKKILQVIYPEDQKPLLDAIMDTVLVQ